MSLRLARYRLKTEWLRFLLGLAFAVILFSWYGTANIIANSFHSLGTFSLVYEMGPERLARELGLDPADPALADMKTAYGLVLWHYRGFLYSRLVMSVNDPISVLVTCSLGVVLLTGLFQKRRLGPLLASGQSRGRLFLSLTAVYFLCIILVWVVSAAYLLRRYCVEFTPEERDFFLVTQLTWFCAVLFNASLAYLAAMLLRRPLPAFLAAVALWFLLHFLAGKPNILPCFILGTGFTVKSWDPGAELRPLLRTDLVAAGFFPVSLIASWFRFRKGGFD